MSYPCLILFEFFRISVSVSASCPYLYLGIIGCFPGICYDPACAWHVCSPVVIYQSLLVVYNSSQFYLFQRSKKVYSYFIFFVSSVIYRFHLSFRMLSYLKLIKFIPYLQNGGFFCSVHNHYLSTVC